MEILAVDLMEFCSMRCSYAGQGEGGMMIITIGYVFNQEQVSKTTLRRIGFLKMFLHGHTL